MTDNIIHLVPSAEKAEKPVSEKALEVLEFLKKEVLAGNIVGFAGVGIPTDKGQASVFMATEDFAATILGIETLKFLIMNTMLTKEILND